MSTFITTHANKLGLKKQDGKKRIEIQVQTCDVKNSTRKSPGNCAFARAAKRSLKGVNKAYFFRSTAWLEYDKKIVRYTLPASAQMEVVAFDRSRSFEPGQYHLTPPAKSTTMAAAAIRSAKRLDRRTSHGKGKKPQPRHKTTNVRGVAAG